MKNTRKTFYSILKNLTKSSPRLKDSCSEESIYAPQCIDLEPFFDTKTLVFKGVFCQSLLNCNADHLEPRIKACLENIHYWHEHNRAIHCILPIDAKLISCQKTLNHFCEIIASSQLPVGYITLAVGNLKTYPLLLTQLESLKRLGLEIDLFEFSADPVEFEWLEKFPFTGLHLSLGFARSASQCKKQAALFQETINLQILYKFHIYFRGITLVHDFVFARNHGIHFCYGPLLMPAVSKHQILKIKESQFAHLPMTSTPPLQSQDEQT